MLYSDLHYITKLMLSRVTKLDIHYSRNGSLLPLLCRDLESSSSWALLVDRPPVLIHRRNALLSIVLIIMVLFRKLLFLEDISNVDFRLHILEFDISGSQEISYAFHKNLEIEFIHTYRI